MGYKKPEDKSIEDPWAELTRMARKVQKHSPSLAAETAPKQRLKILLRSLPSDYAVIIDNIDSNESMTLDRAMLLLQEKESYLQASEQAMWANKTKGKGKASSDNFLRPKDSSLPLRGSESKPSLRRRH